MNEPLALNPHTYVRLTVSQAWDNLPLILLAGLIFSLLCLPALALFILGLLFPAVLVGALTIAPAWAALLAQEAKILQGLKTKPGAMLKAWPCYWLRSAKLGLLAAFPVLMGLFTVPVLAQPEVPMIVWVGLAADALGLLLMTTLFLYAFPLLILYDLDLRTALQNAFILASRHIINTFGLLSLGVLIFLAAIYLSLALLLILPALWGMFIVNNCRLVLKLEGEDDI